MTFKEIICSVGLAVSFVIQMAVLLANCAAL